MNLLKKENWWMWLILLVFSGGTAYIFLGSILNCFNPDAWYTKPKNWLIGLICFIFPFAIMGVIFVIQMSCLVCAKLEVPGKEIYLSPVIWLTLFCIPIIGWSLLFVLEIYILIWPLVMLKRKSAEKLIEG